MLSPLRWILFLLATLLATLLLVLAANRLWSESIVDYVVSDQLGAFEVELVDLQMQPVSVAGLIASSVEVRASGINVSVAGLQIKPLPDLAYQLLIERMRIERVDVSEEISAEVTEPEIGELWRQLQSVLPYMPSQGAISELLVCQNQVCEAGALNWRRHNQTLSIDAYLPQDNIELWVDVSDVIEVEGVFLGRDQSVTNQQVAISRWRVEPTPNLFSVVGSGDARPDIALDLFRVPGLEGSVQSLHVELAAKLEHTATLSELQDALVTNGSLTAGISWLYEADGLQVESEGEHVVTFAYGGSQVNFSLDSHPELFIAYENVMRGQVSLPAVNECELLLVSLEVRCQVSLATMALEAADVVADLTLSELNFEQSEDQRDLSVRLLVSAFDLQSGSEMLSGSASYESRNEKMAILTETFKAWGQEVKVKLEHDLNSGEGSYDLTTLGKLKALNGALRFVTEEDISEIVANLKGQSRVTSLGGWALLADGTFSFNQQTEVDVSGLGIEHDGYLLQEGALRAEMSGWPVISGPVDLKIASASSGLVAEEIEAAFDVYADAISGDARIDGRSLFLELLGGKISSEQFEYDLATNDGSSLLELDQLQLPDLLALQRQDFTCTGTLSGSVPVQIKAGNLSVKGATIAAEAPGGFIQYQPDSSVRALGEENQGLSVVLDAMRNFQFHTLSASVDYSEQGQMIARTSLKGANPDYQGGREVHLNLTLEENLKTLLESLRLGADVAEKVGNKSARGS
jgi:hypothetical protein